jgi:non-heme chloroperoxidase
VPHLATPDGSFLAYSDWGVGPALVFSHSWGLSGDQFHHLVHPLVEAGLRCVTFDRRGHGRSDRPGGEADLDRYADDLGLLVEHLGCDEVVHVGHSFGCSEIVRYAAGRGRGKVRAAIFLAPMLPLLVRTADNPDGVDPELLATSIALLCRDVPAWCELNRAAYFGTQPVVSEGMADWTARQIVDTPVRTLVQVMRIGATTDLRREVAALDVPVLVVQGTADASTPIELTGRRTLPLLADGRLVELDGAGHGLYVNDAPRVGRSRPPASARRAGSPGRVEARWDRGPRQQRRHGSSSSRRCRSARTRPRSCTPPLPALCTSSSPTFPPPGWAATPKASIRRESR